MKSTSVASDMIYFCFMVLTSTGLGDIVSRMPVIARLAGIYPTRVLSE